MARMTRTQICLQDDEYRFLKLQATRSGESLSSMVRALVRASMRQVSAGLPHVWEIAGLLEDSDFSGKDHDVVLYGHDSTGDR